MSDRTTRKRRILLTGGSGLLALNWACSVRQTWDVVLATHRHPVRLRGTTTRTMRLDDPVDLARQVDEIQPDLLVHTAGLTNVDACEADPGLARHANAVLAKNLADVAETRSIPLVHISTDHLFAGDHACYREDDAVQPLNEYARSKLLAEEWVLESCPRALVLRTNFFGWGHARRQSFTDWIIYTLRQGGRLTLFEDVYFTPVLADNVALGAHELVERGAAGIFNLAGDERISKYDFGLRVVDIFGLRRDLIDRSVVTTAGLRAPRPRDMSLDTSKLRAFLSLRPGNVNGYLEALRQQERDGRRGELLDAVE